MRWSRSLERVEVAGGQGLRLGLKYLKEQTNTDPQMHQLQWQCMQCSAARTRSRRSKLKPDRTWGDRVLMMFVKISVRVGFSPCPADNWWKIFAYQPGRLLGHRLKPAPTGWPHGVGTAWASWICLHAA